MLFSFMCDVEYLTLSVSKMCSPNSIATDSDCYDRTSRHELVYNCIPEETQIVCSLHLSTEKLFVNDNTENIDVIST